MEDILNFERLQLITGYKKPSQIEKCLTTQGVPVLFGKKGPFTTVSAIENGLGLDVETSIDNSDQEICF